jgi:hypothetical protein
VRPIRDKIERRVEQLVEQLDAGTLTTSVGGTR